ncbi:DHHW family protein [Turicibacter sanguinis]|uniref:DHHW family protein n=1 Tax=Turicibacter sanguinis TaxID=154288 RepID=UPI0018AADB10|nr:DHHW family protein [Turicibacter sanguinis]MDB8551219.1 DHHW family protein [Turicibacter sanguinis]
MRKGMYWSSLACVWVIFIFVFFTLNLLSDDVAFSEMENRSLAQKPTFKWDRVLEGRYSSKYEKYVNDQFFGRDAWVQMKSQTDLLLGQKENNGVYFGSDDYLIEAFHPASEEILNQNLIAINDFSKELKTSFLMVPNAVYVLSDKLPREAPVIDQQASILNFASQLREDILFVNSTEALKSHKEEAIYYKNDHHWSTLGAYYTFLQLAKSLDLEVDLDYHVLTVTESFDGTLSAKSGFEARSLDTIEVYLPQTDVLYVVTYVEEQQKSTTVYQTEALEGRDKYTFFLGGNHSLVKIQTTSSSENRLLVLKDSYANALIPFLIPYYDEILVVDPRYYFDDLEALIEKEKINELLYVYNANTFFSDNSLNLVLNND